MNKFKSIITACFVAVIAFAGVNYALGDRIDAASTYNPGARDCESNSIIYCGALSASELKSKYNENKTKDLPAIFAHYGVSSSMVNGMTQKSGYVTRDGDVVVGGKTVAKGYVSVGRNSHIGTPVKINGKTYYQHSAGQNWASGVQKIAAHVWLNSNGQFVAGVLYSCGNPFTARNVVPTPKPAPVYACNTLSAATKISRDTYKFNKPTTTAQNGATVKTYNWNFGDGKTLTSTASTVNHTYAKAGTYTVTVSVTFTVNGTTKTVNGANCKTTVTVAPEVVVAQPVYACNTLSAATKISRDTYKFNKPTTTAKNGATVKTYNWNFGDGVTTSSTADTINHTYAKAGAYTVTVSVTFTVNGTTKTVTGNACSTSVTVEPEIVNTPAIDITKTVNKTEHAKVKVGQTFTYEIVVRNTGNVALKDAVVTDKAPAQVALISATAGSVANNVWTYTIPELKVGESKSFTLTAQYATYSTGTHKNTVCVDTPTIPGTPDDCDDATTETYQNTTVCDTTTGTVITVSTEDKDKEGYTTDLTKCEKVKVCDTTVTPATIITVTKNDQNKPGYEATDSDKCQPKTPETPVTPETPTPTPSTTTVTELPHTGIAEGFMSLLGAGSLVGVGAAYATSRRIR